MGNPDVSGLGSNWYQNGSWPSGTVSSTTSDYDTKLAALQTQSNNYLSKKNALESAVAGGVKATITTAKTAFDAARATLLTALNNLKTSSGALDSAELAARKDIDNKLSANMTNFVSQLQAELSQLLTLPETVSQTLGADFANADGARVSARSGFINALNNFYPAQATLNTALNNFQSASDLLLSLKAKYALDLAPPAANAATLAADLAAINTQQNVVNSASNAVSSAGATRDSALLTLKTALANYQTALDAEIDVLNQAALVTHTSVSQFLSDLQNAKTAAITAGQAGITAAQNSDAALYNDLLANFPTQDPVINALIQGQQDTFIQSMLDIGNSTLSEPVDFTAQINLPALPPSGRMSMKQLMQFITLASVMLDQLIREIRRTDSKINILRLTILETSGRNDATKIALQTAWANKLLDADKKYNIDVVETNAQNSSDAVDLIKDIKNNPQLINSYIDQLNSEIDDQNARGIEIVTALNSAIQMAADDYRVQLWADHGQVDDYQDQLQTQVTNLASSDPVKAPLQAVASASAAVISNLKAISALLSVRPINEAAITTAQGQLAAAQSTLTTAINALPATNTSIQTILGGLTSYTNIVTSDQSKLQTHLHDAEVNAAAAINTQITSEASRINSYSQDLTNVIANLEAGDPNIALLTAYNNAIPAVASSLNTLSSHLTTLPINLNTLASDQAAVNNALQLLNTARGQINLNTLTGYAENDIVGIDQAITDLQGTLSSLTLYTTLTTTTPSIPPGLPGQVKTPLMPAPIQLEHQPKIVPSTLTIPSSMPLKGFDKKKGLKIQAPPEPPSPADVEALNKTINKINQSLAPVIDRLQADGYNKILLVDPLYIRPYVPLRDPGSFIDFTVLDSFYTLLTMIIDAQRAQDGQTDNAPTNALTSFAELLGKPNATAGGSKASGVGADVGLEGANLSTSSGNISVSLSAILSTTEFTNYVQEIFAKSGTVAGLAALSALSNVLKGAGQPGLAEGIAAIEGALTPEQKAALSFGVQELVATVEDVPQIKSDLLVLLKSLESAQSLSEEEIQQLLSLLLFLLQLLALLVGAVAVAAGGGDTNIDKIVQKAFEKPEDKVLVTITNDLRDLGVKNIPLDIAPSNPQFLPKFFDAINLEFTPAQQLGFVAKIETVFTEKGITISKDKSIGSAVQDALSSAPTDLAGEIRQQLTKIAQEEGDRLRGEILRDETRRPSLASRLQTLDPQVFAALPQQQVTNITRVLDNSGIEIPGLPAKDRNSLVLAVIGRVITPEQAKGIVDEFLKESAFRTNPAIGNLLARAIESGQSVVTQPVTEGIAQPVATTQALPGTSGQTQPGTPGELPDPVALLARAFKALAKQSSDSNFAQETVTRFADSIREQSDFYQKSLSLILDPANVYVKNFSIATRQSSGHDHLEPLTQIPISG